MAAAHELKVHLGWVVTSYDLGEALANLVQPFWMLPTLTLLGLRARDVMGYTFVVFLGLTPVGHRARHAARTNAVVPVPDGYLPLDP
jgi:short-chain fatty acids transporter